MKEIHKAVRKKDSMSLLMGKPAYTDDLAPKDALIVKIFRSKYANAIVKNVNKSAAMKIPGIVAVYTYEDVPQTRFTVAGQSYPETSPYDRLILDRHVRYVGDAVAIVAGESESAVDTALDMIKVEYEVLPAILDAREAVDNATVIHDEDDAVLPIGMGFDPKRNIVALDGVKDGDVDETLKKCKYVYTNEFSTKKVQQCPSETFRAFTQLDVNGRLIVTTSTQIVFHTRRILARALNMRESMIRIVKPRIGGGFGEKQTAMVEMYVAFVTVKTGRAAKIVYSRREFMATGNPRHAMIINVSVGADEEGYIRAIKQEVLSDSGAYGEHGWATIGLAGRQPLSIYRYVKDYEFKGTVVYTNTTPSGAYRGFGIPQGSFAVESCVNELAHMMNMDPVDLRLKNVIEPGDHMGPYGQDVYSCRLKDCLTSVREDFKWDDKKFKVYPDGRLHGVGVAMTMQGSGIAGIDTASAQIELVQNGYILRTGAADMGTGCDTILAQIAAESLNCSVDDITSLSADTDTSPYDTGSYASSTTYVTGGAVVKACEALKARLIEYAASKLDVPAENLDYLSDRIEGDGKSLMLSDLVTEALVGNTLVLSQTEANSKPISPSPHMAGMAEIAVDPKTGEITVEAYTGYVDCGTVINTALATVQAEGAILQGIGMALTEDVHYSKRGKLDTDSFMTYGIPTRLDCPNIKVGFCESYEESGPYGAKSIGEVTINTSSPAIAEAVYAATGYRATKLPIRSEDLALYLAQKKDSNPN